MDPLAPALGVIESVLGANVALQVPFAAITNVLVNAAPEQTPDHPVNVDPAAATADTVTDVFWGKFAVHVAPQLIPAGMVVTVPVPVPSFDTTSETLTLADVNVAATVHCTTIGLVV